MTVAYATALKATRMTAVKNAIETGSGTATIKIYTSPRPATGGTPTGATLLATHNINNPCGTVSGGDLALDLAAESTVAADGAPNWARVADRDGGFVCDMSVGLPSSGADLEIAAAQLYTGGKLTPTSAYLRDG
jgi:hypothetical protein